MHYVPWNPFSSIFLSLPFLGLFAHVHMLLPFYPQRRGQKIDVQGQGVYKTAYSKGTGKWVAKPVYNKKFYKWV
jgi:hypothetical protein